MNTQKVIAQKVIVRSLPILILMMLSACASQTQLAKIEPSAWTELKCSGFLTWGACWQEAHAICPNGYHVADYLENYTIQRREMSVACKG